MTDQQYLRARQYRDASKLDARTSLHKRFSTNEYRWQRWVFDRLDLPTISDILDVGCGPGDLWLENGDRIPAGWSLVLSDFSPGMLAKARHSLGTRQHQITYRALDAQVIPFRDESFDGVVANHMLFHVPDRHAALSEMRRVMRPEGRLFVTTNGLRHLLELRQLVTRYCGTIDAENVAHAFGLENGVPQLSRHFATVRRYRQENALVVTEVEPIVAYALSMMSEPVSNKAVDALRRSVRGQIASRGAIRIQKDSGMFVATKA
jgi:ubiquinone/menaquinone biosynthesis C-methylase UbiE